MKTVKRWKFIRKGWKSENGNQKWKIGEWVKVDGELDICNWGLHCSKTAYEAFSYVQGEILCLVECRGNHISQDDKECWSEQRIVKAYQWTKKDSVALAIYSAKICLKNYEKEYPNDLRPRQAIEAAKRWLKTGSKKGLSAARSAAWSAESAALSAWSAARSAAWSAESAALSAARSAAWSAQSAAESAAESAAIAKIIKYFAQIVKGLKEIK